MSRERMIYPEMWISDGFIRLPIEARLLWVGLISLADDHGRGKSGSAGLKATVFPLDPIDVESLQEWLGLIAEQGMIRLYSVDGAGYYDIPHWAKYQKLRYFKDSVIPNIPKDYDPVVQQVHNGCTETSLKRDILYKEGKEGDELGPSAQVRFDWKPHIERWNNEIAPALGAPRVQAMPQERVQRLRARLQELPTLWEAVLEEARHLGQFAKTNRFITFDFLMSPTNLAKFLEGNYRPKKS